MVIVASTLHYDRNHDQTRDCACWAGAIVAIRYSGMCGAVLGGWTRPLTFGTRERVSFRGWSGGYSCGTHRVSLMVLGIGPDRFAELVGRLLRHGHGAFRHGGLQRTCR